MVSVTPFAGVVAQPMHPDMLTPNLIINPVGVWKESLAPSCAGVSSCVKYFNGTPLILAQATGQTSRKACIADPAEKFATVAWISVMFVLHPAIPGIVTKAPLAAEVACRIEGVHAA